jgi:hypothetical protein
VDFVAQIRRDGFIGDQERGPNDSFEDLHLRRHDSIHCLQPIASALKTPLAL